MNIKPFALLLLASLGVANAGAQQVLSLDSCRAMALRNNKKLNITKFKQEMAMNTRKAARTKYLPHVDVVGGYTFTSREISLLNKQQKAAFNGLGSNLVSGLSSNLTPTLTGLVEQGLITAEQAGQFGQVLGKLGQDMAEPLNQAGKKVTDAFRTDTRNIFTASVMVTQPIYMGGAIIAANKIADISEQLAANDRMSQVQSTLYDIDQAYWMVVSLKHKKKLADNYLKLVSKFNDDVDKMIKQGVATKSDGLKVNVKMNEAEMTLTQVENGLSLSKMLLCQLCGMPVSDKVSLADEDNENLATSPTTADASVEQAMENRPELRMLQNAVDLARQSTNLVRSAYLPQVALTGGYMMSNPNVFNGFEKKFSGVWNVGVLVRVPVWNWFEGAYKVRASKNAAAIAALELSDAQEKVNLQINQCRYKLGEAYKRLNMAKKNIESADENLRCANLGFKEGVMQTTDVMTAQTAWLQAQTQKIDAEIDVKLSQVGLKKALGDLGTEQ